MGKKKSRSYKGNRIKVKVLRDYRIKYIILNTGEKLNFISHFEALKPDEFVKIYDEHSRYWYVMLTDQKAEDL